MSSNQCQIAGGSNEANDCFYFSFLDPPSTPTIHGLDEGEVLLAGSLKRISCTSIAGNPLATLKWFIGDRELKSEYMTRDNYASAELPFVPRAADNGARLTCQASNVATQQPLVASRNLTVDFAPELVQVTVRPTNPRAGYNATLVCETSSSNPAATVTWWHNGERLEEATEMVMDGDHGGFVTTSHLFLAMTAQHHGAVVTCDAYNELVGQRSHDSITLSVDRKLTFYIFFLTNIC